MSSNNSNSKLSGRVALITGASAGMGRDTARHLASLGVRVVAFARREERLKALVAEIEQAGGTAAYFVGDVSSKDANTGAVAFAVETYGQLDIAFLNAGIYRGSKPLVEMDDEAIDALLAVNVKGVIYGLQAALPELAKAEDGVAIVTSSIMGSRVHSVGSVGSSIYSATKAFVNSLAETAAIEYGGRARVNTIVPGVIKTEVFGEGPGPAAFADRLAKLKNLIPRAGEGQEIAELVEYISGASYVTGSHFQIDGGWSAGPLPAQE